MPILVTANSEQWLAQVREEIIDPEREIVDPHHHLWRKRFGKDYLLAELQRDTDLGHKIEKTVFIECHAFYDKTAADYLQPLGETRVVEQIASESKISGGVEIAGIVAHADLTLAGTAPDKLDELLEAHRSMGGKLFKGIRHAAASDAEPEKLTIPGMAPRSLYSQNSFRDGIRMLAEKGLTLDCWHYHHQNQSFLDLARAVPQCTIILDHFGTPLGVGKYRYKADEIYEQWKKDILEISKCPNVVAKLGGLAMPDNGYMWHTQERPPTSEEFKTAQEKYYKYMIDCFGPERCMFESNFPVDRLSISYDVLWNAFKKIAESYSETEKKSLFKGTASKIYRL
ncbi:MAG: amidohydrolase [Deltaproteobacteria bacterium]|jgi:predicted TIM-barrel fold metal-dependent hydrolase|nr:amidohydrolase [Deltaproteobacteria bacterium]|tara:strand:+ start:1331 stop:2353 length:1023 start_codon:yes stop_codon:yes gene_type:complete